MAKSIKGPVKTFEFPCRVEVRPARLVPLALLRYVDPGKLSRGSHKVEVGYSEGGCCRNSVYAVIRNGMVTGIEVEPCQEKKEIRSKEFRALVSQAFKAIGADRQKWKSVPVKEFFSSATVLMEIGGRGWCVVISWGGQKYSCCLFKGGEATHCIPAEDEIIR